MISSLLVANRGEIATRIFRTAKALGIACLAIYTDADADAPYVKQADDAIRLSGRYLDAPLIVDAALTAGAEAVHPGYGFLSENAPFARLVVDAGLVWVGPSPELIELMGDKLQAKSAAIRAGVPILPSSDDPTAAASVGFPLLVKAAAGGGGKGMRTVRSMPELADAVQAAQREAHAAFGDSRVFLERFVTKARHIEIQIVGDRHGHIFHLGERECSIQRRHQKILEESPSPIVNDELREAIGGAAVKLARSIGYDSIGTVEFLVDDSTREYFFLEVNTRIQVEHPVTEAVTGIDLVALQLVAATGEPLAVDYNGPRGHAIEARLYAEDPAAGFLPATGTLTAYEEPQGAHVRWDSGVASGAVVGIEFDPMLAKVVASGSTRAEAAQRLASALEHAHLGGITTNRDFLVETLRHPVFLAGETTTDFIDRVRIRRRVHDIHRASIVASLWLHSKQRDDNPMHSNIPPGWRNGRLPLVPVDMRYGDEPISVAYEMCRDGSILYSDGSRARILGRSSTHIDVEVDGRQGRHRVTADDHRIHIQLRTGTVTLCILPRFAPPATRLPAGGLVAPMPGVVLEVRCSLGDAVSAGQTLLVLEAMKMEHLVRAPAEGVISAIAVGKGEQVENGQVLLVLEAALHEEPAE